MAADPYAKYQKRSVAKRRARLIAAGSVQPNERGLRLTRVVYTGRPCALGHTERYATGACVVCHREKTSAYMRRARAEKLPSTANGAQHSAAWRERNPALFREIARTSAAKYYAAQKDSVAYKLKRTVRVGVNKALRGRQKSESALKLLGTTIEGYRGYLEARFTDAMTWANYGTVWEIDHVLPLSRFDMTDPEQQRAAFSYKNTRPLSIQENRAKGNRA